MTDRAIRTRGHHLLCMLTYAGKGYSENFINNFNEIVFWLNKGALIHVVKGPDDVCHGRDLRGCPQRRINACSEAVVHQRDRRALHALNLFVFAPVNLSPGHRFPLHEGLVQDLRVNFTKGTIRGACADCDWHRLCSAIADSGYKNVKLMPDAVPFADEARRNPLKKPRATLAFPVLIR